MKPADLAILLILAAFWGGSFMFIRVAAPVMGPVALMEARVLIAGLVLLAYGLVTRALPPWRPLWRQALVVGALNSAFPFLLIAWAELVLPASLAATLNATTPLFGSLIAALVLGEAVTPGKLVGLLMGVAGVGILVGLGPLPLSGAVLMAVGASLLAAMLYGIAATYVRKTPQASPLAMATYSQLAAALILAPLLPFGWPTAMPGPVVWANVAALAVLSTSIGVMLYFHLIRQLGPMRATTVTYVAPVFGTLWGALFLHEAIGLGAVLGLLLILASVAWVTSKPAKLTAGV